MQNFRVCSTKTTKSYFFVTEKHEFSVSNLFLFWIEKSILKVHTFRVRRIYKLLMWMSIDDVRGRDDF